ncbi:hypothetical protein CL1_1495 [Thermococcus cleftensis]|uniref:Uncharacterized protein n=1 Tax=Thermococcus cleftensis (strain DSM 27260 / KACC 17922 / CL1) TaxID=163003 RepID=I3ZVG0_THECF|nr:hypothetical protein [Thermococcus cleftensis]AFL95694.1 hypothetical protein CL1_1495 [Thermococcus cleftensis]
MEKAYLSMVTPGTLEVHAGMNFLATGIKDKLKDKAVKTVWDLLSDVFSLREGDLIYFWVYEQGEEEDFLGTWKVEGEPYFDTVAKCCGSSSHCVPGNYPFRVQLNPQGLWKDPLPGDYVYSQPQHIGFLWPIIGKKSLNRGKSLTSLPPYGDSILNGIYSTFQKVSSTWNTRGYNTQACQNNYAPGNNAVKLDKTWFYGLFQNNNTGSASSLRGQSISSINISQLPVMSSKDPNLFVVEKALEAWFSMFIDKPEMDHFWNQLSQRIGINFNKNNILWFSNYHPLTITGKNVDFIVLFKKNNHCHLVLVELKREHLTRSIFEQASQEVETYERIARNLFTPLLLKNCNDLEFHTVIVGGYPKDGRKNGSKQEIKNHPRYKNHVVFGYNIGPSGNPPVSFDLV